MFSPDGRWVAYASTESGSPEVYIRPFTPGKTSELGEGGRWLVSTGGGLRPRWRGDNRELYYLGTTPQQFAVEIIPGSVPQPRTPRLLFPVSLIDDYMVVADGTRFLSLGPASEGTVSPFRVVTNWQAGLKK